jgi:choline dehydrogenase
LTDKYSQLTTLRTAFNEEGAGRGPIRVSRVLRHDWSPEDLAFEEACHALGFATCDDLNDPDARNVGPTPSSSQGGTRVSSARAYLSTARGRPNLTIIANTVVHRLMLDGVRVVGVQTSSGELTGAAEVILAAGALKSPHLLSLSGIGPADQLREHGITPLVDLPGVGRNLQDHPNIALTWRGQPDASVREPARPQLGMRGLAGLRLRLTTTGSDTPDDGMIRSFGSTTMEGGAAGVAGTRMAVALSQPADSGAVVLASGDPAVPPSVSLRYLVTERDRSRMREAIKLALELTSQGSVRKFVGEPRQPDLADPTTFDAWMLRQVSTGHHLTSTCRMGPDNDEHAVVDQYGRVRGIEGLRVADASIMPKVTRPNTQATTTMIGERIADFAKEQDRS